MQSLGGDLQVFDEPALGVRLSPLAALPTFVAKRHTCRLADQRIASGRRLIEKQRGLIERPALGGHDLGPANLLLTKMLEVQVLFEALRQRIVVALDG